jgi:hypothetical protein
MPIHPTALASHRTDRGSSSGDNLPCRSPAYPSTDPSFDSCRGPRHLNAMATFHRFADLPLELRILIWEAAAEERVLKVRRAESKKFY